jgi:hypothetical protein
MDINVLGEVNTTSNDFYLRLRYVNDTALEKKAMLQFFIFFKENLFHAFILKIIYLFASFICMYCFGYLNNNKKTQH